MQKTVASQHKDTVMPRGTIIKLVRVASSMSSMSSTSNGSSSNDGGYGIIRGQDGIDVYFVNSAVCGCRFDELASGQNVHYTVEEGPLRRAATVSPTE